VPVTVTVGIVAFLGRLTLWRVSDTRKKVSPDVTGAMKAWKKIAIGVGVLAVLALIIGFTVHQSSKNVATVQTGKAQRQDLSTIVSASGEIKPKTYVNIGANAFGKITRLYVKEGDHVKKGQMLAQLENVQ